MFLWPVINCLSLYRHKQCVPSDSVWALLLLPQQGSKSENAKMPIITIVVLKFKIVAAILLSKKSYSFTLIIRNICSECIPELFQKGGVCLPWEPYQGHLPHHSGLTLSPSQSPPTWWALFRVGCPQGSFPRP